VRPDGLLAAAPLVLRFAPDRRRYAAASNLAEAGQVVEPAFCLSAVRITAKKYADPTIVFRYPKILVRPDGFEPPTTAFEAQCSIQLSYGRPRAV
jgi:hypothetical protein